MFVRAEDNDGIIRFHNPREIEHIRANHGKKGTSYRCEGINLTTDISVDVFILKIEDAFKARAAVEAKSLRGIVQALINER